MEDMEIISLWKAQNARIDQSLTLNRKLLHETLQQKARISLKGLRTIRWTGIILGIGWCIGIATLLLSSWPVSSVVFKISLGINFFVTAIAVGLYIYHLVLIHGFDNSQNIVTAQQKLSELKVSNLKTLGVLWIQLPVFSTWYMSVDWMQQSPLSFWGIQVPIVLLQALAGLWLYRNLNIRNHDKKWFRWFVSKGEFARIEKALEITKEMEEFAKVSQ